MARGYPLSIAEFFETLPIARFKMKPGDSRTFTETGGGEVIPASRGQRLWRGDIQLDLDYHESIAGHDADLSVLEEPGASFLVYDTRKPYPTADPDGALIAGYSPQIAELDANNREFRISGLPGSYVLTKGDLVGWTYGSNPTRYAVHRIVVGGVASGAGLSSLLEVTPFIQPGASLGTAVSLVRPPLKAKVPQADYGGGRSVVSDGGSFSFVQTLR